MTKQEFISNLSEEIEFDTPLTADTVLKDHEEWDSMAAMVLIGFVSDNFDVTLTGDEVTELTTVDSLIAKIGEEKFD